MRSAYCIPRGSFALVRVIVLCAVLAACSSSGSVSPSVTAAPAKAMTAEQILATMTSIDCTGDTEPVMVAPGWMVVWRKVFDGRIARPPVVDGSQMILVERADARPATLKDTFSALDPQTGNLLWKVTDANNPVPFKARHMLSIKSSPKYWLLLIQYVKPGDFNTPNPVQYELVVDRKGKVVFDSGLNVSGSARSIAISDDALFDYFDGQGGVFVAPYMRRVDLPSGTNRWMHRQDTRDWRGVLPLDDNLYVFATNLEQYTQADGMLTTSVGFTSYSLPGDMIVQKELAIVRSEGMEAFDLPTLARKWFVPVTYRYRQDSNAFWGDILSITVTSDSVYLFDALDTLLRLDLQTGKQLWQTASPGLQAMSRPVVMQDMVYALFADGTVRAFSMAEGTPMGVVARTPLWYRQSPDETREFLDLVGGLGVSDNTLIVTTGCRNVFALQREP